MPASPNDPTQYPPQPSPTRPYTGAQPQYAPPQQPAPYGQQQPPAYASQMGYNAGPHQPQYAEQPAPQQPRKIVERKPARHWLHLIMTICTGGLWLIVWIPAAAKGRKTVTKIK